MPSIDVELLTLNEQLCCKDLCHQWTILDTENTASLTHPRTFTHVDNDAIMNFRESSFPSPTITSIDNITYNKVVETGLDDAVLNSIIYGTNEHGVDDPKYDYIPVNEAGRAVMKIFIAIMIMHGIKKCWLNCLWTNDVTKGCLWLTRHMTLHRFQAIRKHICFNEYEHLKAFGPLKKYAKFESGLELLLKNTRKWRIPSLWRSIDESRTIHSSCKSKGLYTFERQKPIRKGRNTYVVAEKIGNMNGYSSHMIPYAGKIETYKMEMEPDHDICNKTDNLVHQLLKQATDEVGIPGMCFAMDKKFSSIYVQEKVGPQCNNAASYGPIQSSRKCLPKYWFKSEDYKNRIANMDKFDYIQLQCNKMHLTIWNDSDIVILIDSCFDPLKLVRMTRSENGRTYHLQVPTVIYQYNKQMGFVDNSNQRQARNPIGIKSVRSHNRTFWMCFEKALLVNAEIIYAQSAGKSRTNSAEWREQMCHQWVDQHIELKKEACGGVLKKKGRPKSLKALKNGLQGNITVHQLIKRKGGRLKCYHCKKKTSWKCDTCTIHDCEFGFCGRNLRNCFATFHEAQNWSYSSD